MSNFARIKSLLLKSDARFIYFDGLLIHGVNLFIYAVSFREWRWHVPSAAAKLPHQWLWLGVSA
jgi:hypothetical protein